MEPRVRVWPTPTAVPLRKVVRAARSTKAGPVPVEEGQQPEGAGTAVTHPRRAMPPQLSAVNTRPLLLPTRQVRPAEGTIASAHLTRIGAMVPETRVNSAHKPRRRPGAKLLSVASTGADKLHRPPFILRTNRATKYTVKGATMDTARHGSGAARIPRPELSLVVLGTVTISPTT